MPDDDWGTWASKRERGFTRGLEATVEERLAWVEEMLKLALAAGALPKPRDPWGRFDPPPSKR